MSFQQEIDKCIKEKRLYFVGDSLPSDWYAGFKLWLKLAEEGDAKAQYNVGRCYDRGDGIDQDLEQADFWYQRAAGQKEPRSHYNLYLLYSNKDFPKRYDQQAEKYLAEAVLLKESRAIEHLAQRKADAEAEEAKRKAEILADDAKRKAQALADEAHRKAGEQLEHAKQRLVKSESSKAAIQKCLNEGDFESAKLEAGKAESEGYIWAKRVQASLDLRVTLRIEKDTKKETYAGGVFQGTTQYYTTKTTTSWLVGNIVNRSSQDIDIQLVDDKNKHHYLCNSKDIRAENEKIKANSSKDYYKRAPETVAETNTYTKFHFGLGDLDESERSSYAIDIPRAIFNDICKIKSFYVPLKKPFNTGSGCFVLTASFGNENDPVVVDFRRFRDQHLLRTVLGQAVVKIYYQYGPALADCIREKPRTKAVLRQIFSVVRMFLPK